MFNRVVGFEDTPPLPQFRNSGFWALPWHTDSELNLKVLYDTLTGEWAITVREAERSLCIGVLMCLHLQGSSGVGPGWGWGGVGFREVGWPLYPRMSAHRTLSRQQVLHYPHLNSAHHTDQHSVHRDLPTEVFPAHRPYTSAYTHRPI